VLRFYFIFLLEPTVFCHSVGSFFVQTLEQKERVPKLIDTLSA